MSVFAGIPEIYLDVLAGDLLRYVLGAGGVYLFVNLALFGLVRGQKIRDKAVPLAQIKREILASLRTVVVFAAAGTTIALGERAGLIDIYFDGDRYGWAYFGFSVVLLIVAHDAWFYWSHRALHYPPLFRRFHRLHHRSHNPTPFTSYSFDVGEAVINAIYLPMILLILPAHPAALFAFVTHMIVRNALGHCGIEVFPARRDGRPLFGWMTTVTHHDLHHANAHHNMGLYFSWWDRLCGTEHPNYLEAFKSSGKQITFLGAAKLLTASVIFAAAITTQAKAADLNGAFASPGMGMIVNFEQCPGVSEQRCGRLLWVWDTTRSTKVKIGEFVIWGLKQDGASWSGGQLKSPEDGRVYRGTLTQDGRDLLTLKGCAGPFCRTQIWRSVASIRTVLRSAP